MTGRTIIGVALAAAALAGCGSDDSGGGSDGKTVRVAGATTIEPAAPFVVADAKGYFEQGGLDVKPTHLKAGQDAIPLLARGKIDVAIGGVSAGMLNAVHQGLKFKYVGELSRTTGEVPGPAQLDVSRKAIDSGKVRSVADLKGETIAISGGSGATGSLFLYAMLAKAGLKLSDVKVINVDFPDMETAVKSGAAAAAIAAPPFNTKMEKDGVSKALVSAPSGLSGIAVLYNPRFASTPAAQAFFDALVKASGDLQGTQRKSDSNLQALSRASGEPVDILERIPFSAYPPDVSPDSKTLSTAQEAFLGAGLLDYDSPIEVSDFRDDSFAEHAGGG